MHHFGFLNSKCALPAPASPEHAAWGMEQWLQVASGDGETAAGGNGLKDFAAEVANDPVGRRLLESVFGNSPFLTASILKDPAFARRLMNAGSDDTFGEITDERVEEIPSALKEDLVRVGGGTDFAALEDRIRATADAGYAIFKDIIETLASESEKENNR